MALKGCPLGLWGRLWWSSGERWVVLRSRQRTEGWDGPSEASEREARQGWGESLFLNVGERTHTWLHTCTPPFSWTLQFWLSPEIVLTTCQGLSASFGGGVGPSYSVPVTQLEHTAALGMPSTESQTPNWEAFSALPSCGLWNRPPYRPDIRESNIWNFSFWVC